MTYRVPDTIVYVDGSDFDEGEALFITKVPSGESILLRDLARLIWMLAAEGADAKQELERFIERPPADSDTVVEAFLDELVARGLLATDGA